MIDFFAKAKKEFLCQIGFPPSWMALVSPFWLERMVMANSFIVLCNSPEEAVGYAQRCGVFDHRLPVSHEDGKTEKLHSILDEEFPEFKWEIEESQFSAADTRWKKNGYQSSSIFPWHLHQFLTPKRHLDLGKIKNVLEVGGGYGALARIWLKLTDVHYTIFDLPSSLFFQRCYLGLNDCLDESRVTFLPFYDGIRGAFDLGIVCACLGEMQENLRGHLWKYLKSQCHWIYSLNYYKNEKDFGQGAGNFEPDLTDLVTLHRNENPTIPTVSSTGKWLELILEQNHTIDTPETKDKG